MRDHSSAQSALESSGEARLNFSQTLLIPDPNGNQCVNEGIQAAPFNLRRLLILSRFSFDLEAKS